MTGLLPLRQTWRRQLPLTVVLGVVGIGLVIVGINHWVLGLDVMALGLIGGALIRATLPRRGAGLLAVRSKWLDVTLLGSAGALMLGITTSLR